MTPIIKEITFEVSNPDVPQTVLAKQGDADSRFLKARFVCDGEEVSISTNASVVINAFRLSDGMSESFEGVVNDDNTVLVPLHQWMLAFEGVVQSDISVFSGEKKLTSPIFNVKVERAVNVDNLAYFEESIAFYEGESTVFYNPYITKIGKQMFYAEREGVLTEIDVPNVTTIGYQGIYSCTYVTRLNVPKVETLENAALRGCTGLTYLDLRNLKTTAVASLQGLTGIETLNLPSLITMGEQTVRECTALKEIAVPSLTTIARSAFYLCTSLKEIVLPSITFISTTVFLGCESLQRIIITNDEKVCTLEGQTLFSSNDIGSKNLRNNFPNFEGIYVPDALVDSYKTATNWTLYAEHIKPLTEWDGYEDYLKELEVAE